MQKIRKTTDKSCGLRNDAYTRQKQPSEKVFRTNFFAILIIFCVLIITLLVVFSSNHSGVNGFERQLVFNLSYSTDITDTSRCEVEVGWVEIKDFFFRRLKKKEKIGAWTRKVTLRIILIPAVISVDYCSSPSLSTMFVLSSNELICEEWRGGLFSIPTRALCFGWSTRICFSLER